MPEIVGRDDERRALLEYTLAGEAGRRAAVVRGEAGIGKTTIWESVVDAARAGAWQVLVASPAEPEVHLSFGALTELLAPVAETVLERLAPARRRALSVALRIEEPGARAPDRLTVGLAVLDALRNLARERGLVVAIDDAQWLDAASRAALEFALRRVDVDLRLLVSLRPDGGARPTGLAIERSRWPMRQIDLGPMSVGDVHHLVVDRLGVTFARPVLQRIHELSGGNPFYALELAAAIGGGWVGLEPGGALPPALDALVRTRLRRLPARTQVALAAAAALAHPTIGQLERARVGADIEGVLAPAVTAGVVEMIGDEIRFSHPLLASAALGRVLPHRRPQLHAALADAVDGVEERARHLALAAEGPSASTAAAVEAAARLAFARGDTNDAARLAAQARELTPPELSDDVARRTLVEAEYRFESGDPTSATQLLDRLIDTTPAGPVRATLLSRQARVRHFASDINEAIGLLERALAEVGDDRRARAQIEEGLAWSKLLVRHDLQGAVAHARNAVALARDLGDRATLAEALAAHAIAGIVVGEPGTESVLDEAMALEPATLELRVLRHPSFARGYWLALVDELDKAREVFAELHRRAQAQGDESALPPIYNHLALIEALAGNWFVARRYAEEAYALAVQDGQRPSQAASLSRLALIEAWSGATDAARASARQALEITCQGGFDPAEPACAIAGGGELAVWALGSAQLAAGEHAAADAFLRPLALALLEAGVREFGEVRCLSDAVEASLGSASAPSGGRLLAALGEMAAATDRPAVRGAADRCTGLALAADGDLRAAVTTLERAVAAHERAGMPLEHGRSLLALGEVRRRGKEKRAARESLEAADAIFGRLGARGWSQRARRELARIGGRTAATGLTETERRIVDLVAEGRSNREIAAELFVTPKTVETSLSRIYAKLGVHSRTALVREAASRM